MIRLLVSLRKPQSKNYKVAKLYTKLKKAMKHTPKLEPLEFVKRSFLSHEICSTYALHKGPMLDINANSNISKIKLRHFDSCMFPKVPQ